MRNPSRNLAQLDLQKIQRLEVTYEESKPRLAGPEADLEAASLEATYEESKPRCRLVGLPGGSRFGSYL